jgi:osmotically-inducible protein OsmY
MRPAIGVWLKEGAMRTDNDLQRDIVAELNWEPSIRNEDIAVGVKEGVVTLAGTVDTYSQRYTAERVVERIAGVRALVDELTVKPGAATGPSDVDIAHAAVNAFKWDIQVPDDRVKVKVTRGVVTLEGEVPWYYQRAAAERAVRHLAGVRGITNLIRVQETATPSDVKQRITDALLRQAETDAGRITVEVSGHTATLRGSVRSLAEKKDAEYAAWRARGVTRVDNRLSINPLATAVV